VPDQFALKILHVALNILLLLTPCASSVSHASPTRCVGPGRMLQGRSAHNNPANQASVQITIAGYRDLNWDRDSFF
jgi:hypothetical protein